MTDVLSYQERPITRSAFVERVGWGRVATDNDGETLAVVTVTLARGATYAYAAPPWVAGLLLAADAQGEGGISSSVGRIYNRHLSRRFERVA